MFDHLFENRNSTITNLIKLGDCLGRSLRENVELFTIDSEMSKVAYLSESGKVITGEYTFDEDLLLNHINIQEADIFTDNKIFDSYVEEKVSTFVGRLDSNKYGEANDSFSDILTLWENRLKFETVKKHLAEKKAAFSDSQDIVESAEFQRFLEVMPQITAFLEEKKTTIQNVQEIENAIKLSNSVSKAFNFPRLSYDSLQEEGKYTISRGINKSIYEMICKQELVKKELLESKKNFGDVWATNPRIRELASLIFEDSVDQVLESLVEAVIEVPFLALTTKKQLFDSINNAFSLTENSNISTKDLKTYVSQLFEMKKPLKAVILSLLNEKYGINVQNLKDTPTFSSLSNTQVVIFESLARLAPKGSVVKDTLSDLSKLLKNKNGVEVIDVNDVLQECFEVCEYNSFCEDFNLIDNLSFEDILEEDMTVAELLEKAKKNNKGDEENDKLLLDKDREKVEADNLSPEQAKGRDSAKAMEKAPESEADLEDDSEKIAAMPPPKKKNGDEKEKGDVKEEAEAPAPEAPPAEAPEAEGEVPPEGEASDQEQKPVKPQSKEDFLDSLKDMDDVLMGVTPDEEKAEEKAAKDDEQEA